MLELEFLEFQVTDLESARISDPDWIFLIVQY